MNTPRVLGLTVIGSGMVVMGMLVLLTLLARQPVARNQPSVLPAQLRCEFPGGDFSVACTDRGRCVICTKGFGNIQCYWFRVDDCGGVP